MNITSRHVSAPRGTTRSCKGWPQEAALRMLMNNLDPEVAERPNDLVVYGGSGRAARSWQAFDAIVDTLRRLEHDETLVVQSGKPVAVFRTHPWSPRVIIGAQDLPAIIGQAVHGEAGQTQPGRAGRSLSDGANRRQIARARAAHFTIIGLRT